MNRPVQIGILLVAAVFLIANYFFNPPARQDRQTPANSGGALTQFQSPAVPDIAFLFTGLGRNNTDLEDIYTLQIPVSVAVRPQEKYAKNVAHMAQRCNFTVFIDLPVDNSKEVVFRSGRYASLHSSMSERKIKSLLRNHLNAARMASGVAAYFIPATKNSLRLIDTVFSVLEQKDMVFIDLGKAPGAEVCRHAENWGVPCVPGKRFLDDYADTDEIRLKMGALLEDAREDGRAVIIVKPKGKLIEALRNMLPHLKKDYNFVTLKEYLDL